MKTLAASLYDLAAFITVGGIFGTFFIIAITLDNLKTP